MTTDCRKPYPALFTDLYEIAMLAAYHARGLDDEAVFELHLRELPQRRHYAVAAGLDDVLDYLQALRFRDDEIEWLDGLGRFDPAFLDALSDFRFTGDVYAVPEGTAVFPHEPIVQVVAPLPEAQIAETFLLNQVHVQSLAATKASRLVRAAQGRAVTDFGTRRAHGTDAAIKVARAGYIGGLSGTSNVLAARRYGIPCVGTMAHSFVLAYGDELESFDAFSRVHRNTTLLIDTFDTLEGVKHVIELARRRGEAFDVGAVRLDSGDLAELIPRVRHMFDEAGLAGVGILASGGLDEHRIRRLVDAGLPVDGFGVGTELAVSNDAPHLDLSYKLVEYDGQPKMKLSPGKVSLPGRKQVFRQTSDERFTGDIIAAFDEAPSGSGLLEKVMESGRRIDGDATSLDAARRRRARNLDALPAAQLEPGRVRSRDDYPVVISDRLARTRRRLEQELRQDEPVPAPQRMPAGSS